MFLVTGQVGDQSCQNKQMSADELIKAYKLPIEKGKPVTLKLHPSQIAYDSVNKREKHALRRLLQPHFTASTRDGDVSIRMCKRIPVEDPKTKILKNDPPNVIYEGRDVIIDTKKDLEKAVFLLLHPSCEQSPFHHPGTKTVWIHYDRKADAKKAVDSEMLVNKLIVEVFNETDAVKLKRIALGFKMPCIVDGRQHIETIPGAKDMDLNEIKTALVRIARKHAVAFQSYYRDAAVLFNGTIRDAIDTGLVVMRSVGGGHSAWFWRPDVQGGTELCRVAAGMDGFTALANHVSDQTAWLEFFRVVNDNTSKSIQAENMKALEPLLVGTLKAPKDMTGLELVAEAEKDDAISFVPGTGVLLLDRNYAQAGNVLHVVVHPKRWRQELAEAIETTKIKKNRILQRLGAPVEAEEENGSGSQT